MAINQAKILLDFEKILDPIDKKEFIFGFLAALGYSKTTITRLKSNDGRNIAAYPSEGEVAFKKGIYFKPVDYGQNIHEVVEFLKNTPIVASNSIRFAIVTDWVDFVAVDLKVGDRLECLLLTLPENYTFFLPLAGFEKSIIYSENPADVKAAEQMGRLFDLIKEKSQPKSTADVHALNVFLTRLLFCFFAEDTGIFEKSQMSNAIASYTSEDGSDLAIFFNHLFEVLNENDSSPLRKARPVYLKSFPYVNGGLFKNKVPIPDFGAKARRVLLDCSTLKWSEINPDIFGSMFQSVIDEEQRGSLGQHYTSVTNIMKVIQPLFLDKLEYSLKESRSSESKLKSLLNRISNIKIFDPACGSGNFLIIAYKELRKIEMAIFKALNDVSKQDVMFMSNIKLSQFYGIEIDDFAHEIALLSLWLTEHQMNQVFRSEFGYSPAALPLKESGNIFSGNSLQLDWASVCPKSSDDEVYVCGNPPFLGHNARSPSQVADMEIVFDGISGGFKKLDYVASWFWKGAQYISNSKAEVAFVSTNSICQGIQVELLWPEVFGLGLKINFAYQTFVWKNSAKANAAVHVVIVGLSKKSSNKKKLFKLMGNKWIESYVENISPYLIPGNDIAITKRSTPFGSSPIMLFGNMPNDGGHLLMDRLEKEKIEGEYPEAAKWIKQILGASEFMNGGERYCLWLKDASQNDIDSIPPIKARVEEVRRTRLSSSSEGARNAAVTPHLFWFISHPLKGEYILIPGVSSERRSYIPIGFCSPDITVASNANLIIPNATLYDFTILTSKIHMDWMRVVGGRLKSDYRYSAQLVYNTFPWPTVSDQDKAKVAKLGEKILLIREAYPDKTLAKLYDPDLMPPDLLEAHQTLDAAVDRLYREKQFRDDSERLEHLFLLYENLNPSSRSLEGNGELW